MNWPERGVYFFFETGETRPDGNLRVVRVGTHAVSTGSRTTLWKRLSQHRGTKSTGSGNHRGSIFRRHVGASLIESKRVMPTPDNSWGQGSNAPKHVREGEILVEQAVSQYVGAMPFLWLSVNDEPGKQSDRSMIERNSIALLSCINRNEYHEPATTDWLGHNCPNPTIRASGLWNVNHANESYNPDFLHTLEHYAARQLK